PWRRRQASPRSKPTPGRGPAGRPATTSHLTGPTSGRDLPGRTVTELTGNRLVLPYQKSPYWSGDRSYFPRVVPCRADRARHAPAGTVVAARPPAGGHGRLLRAVGRAARDRRVRRRRQRRRPLA